jgi:adenylate cyclase
VLGLIKHRHDWDSNGAASEFQKAIELDPADLTAHYWYANYFQSIGRPDEEMAQLEIARHLDPMHSQVLCGIANNSDAKGHHEEAISIFTQAISLDEHNWAPHYDLGGSYARSGNYEEAIREFSRTLELSGGNLRIKAMLARMYALTGKTMEARQILEEIKGKPNSAFSMAEVYVALGNKDQALEYLQQAIDERCGWVVFMWNRENLAPLHSDSRFKEMIARVGFPGV